MGSKDKALVAITLVAILFIGYIAILNYPNPGKELSGVDYYTSDETITLGAQAGSSYDSLTSIGRVECPGLSNNTSKGSLVNCSGVVAKGNPYRVVYLPYTQECAGLPISTLNKSNYSTYMKDSGKTGETLTEMFSSGNLACDGYSEIVAPFAYSYESANLANDANEITVMNASGNCRMVIKNYVNWFCAGTVGTSTKYSNTEPEADWNTHENHHMSRVGYGSGNYEAGSPGDLIAYGNSDTIITFECLTTSGWKTLPVYKVVLGKGE